MGQSNRLRTSKTSKPDQLSYRSSSTSQTTPNESRDGASHRTVHGPLYRWHVGHRNVHQGLGTVYMLLSMPEVEVHARGEDCENKDLETVHTNLEKLSVGIRNRIVTCIPYEGGVYEIHLRNINDYIVSRGIVYTHLKAVLTAERSQPRKLLEQ
jgi:hypothetical protein